MSMRPVWAAASSTARRMSSRFDASPLQNAAFPPFLRMPAATLWPVSSSMSTTRTQAPSSANRSQIALPIPLAPPVTIAILSFNRFIRSPLGTFRLLPHPPLHPNLALVEPAESHLQGGTGEMSDGQARFVLAHAASHPVKLNASVLDRVLPVRLAQIFRERRFRPWEACDALPLSPHQRRNVVDQYLSPESMDDLPSALLELSRSIVMDLNSIRAATSQVTRVASWSGPLKVWLLMQNSLLWDLLAPKIAVWARVRMDQGANGWADDYLFFGDAANPPADRVSTLANALLELWDDPAFELKQRERWTRVIAD